MGQFATSYALLILAGGQSCGRSNTPDKTGTCEADLWTACKGGNVEKLDFVLGVGNANLEEHHEKQGYTVLSKAAEDGHVGMVAHLIQAKAKLETRIYSGMTAL